MSEIEKAHIKHFKATIDKKLEDIIKIPRARNKPLYEYLRKRLEDILVGKPSVLSEISEEIRVSCRISFSDKTERAKKQKLYTMLLKIFSYENFVSSYPPKEWGAYQLVSKLKVNVCPYCNRQYTFTVINDDPAVKGKTRARLDHFYDKATYPYLAVSLYNLIPCCSICNSDFKGSIDFSYKTHLHPYVDEFGEHFKFGIDMLDKTVLKPGVSKIDYLLGKGEEFEIVIRDTCSDPDIKQKVNNNLEVFKIKELYNHHKDYVLDLIKIRISYSDSQIDELFRQYSGILFASREDVIQMITSNYVVPEELDKRVLAKLTRDICEELNLYIK
ncbi:hypothetical protein [Paenibacillus sp. BGI2013]|uniref:hypothetical protein n=1 Tax=Paenibacillus sp. BGI2013 TaxID=2058902 RepID=UPI0015D65656|nr:hypothetical protein [Paenibacillus sp. BGI2013]